MYCYTITYSADVILTVKFKSTNELSVFVKKLTLINIDNAIPDLVLNTIKEDFGLTKDVVR